ncbi:MAG: hypothetical protein P1V97_07215 [Planctomycetota bacterium]|nr:hypothetical protein [Planctomycetota bacterium]
MKSPTFFLAILMLCPSFAFAQSVDKKLGPSFSKKSPAEKYALLSTAVADKTITSREGQVALDNIVLKEIRNAADSKAKLVFLGQFRSTAFKRLKDINNTRRLAKKSYVSPLEPDLSLQIAIAISYVADSAGKKPTLAKLSCLKLVRENTSWSAHSELTHAFVTEALARDKAYMSADHKGKLLIIQSLCDDKGYLSKFDRKRVEQSVLSAWISESLGAGKSPAELLLAVKQYAAKGHICFLTAQWAQGFLVKLADAR